MEWPSFLVLFGTQGARRKVKSGQSYYVGDPLIESLIKPEAVRLSSSASRQRQAGKRGHLLKFRRPLSLSDTVEIVQRKLLELGDTEVGRRPMARSMARWVTLRKPRS